MDDAITDIRTKMREQEIISKMQRLNELKAINKQRILRAMRSQEMFVSHST